MGHRSPVSILFQLAQEAFAGFSCRGMKPVSLSVRLSVIQRARAERPALLFSIDSLNDALPWPERKTKKRLEFEAGKCRVCGCADDEPCRMVPDPDAPIAGQVIVNSAWADETRTLCTNPECLR